MHRWDGRGVDQAIESDSFLMPRVEDLIDRIARCKFEAERAGYTPMIFSALEMSSYGDAYEQCTFAEVHGGFTPSLFSF